MSPPPHVIDAYFRSFQSTRARAYIMFLYEVDPSLLRYDTCVHIRKRKKKDGMVPKYVKCDGRKNEVA